MRQCLQCRGAVPEGLESCPNCNVGRRSSALKKALIAVSISVSSCTSCLPYGIPPCPDGGTDCYDYCNLPLPDGGDPKDDTTTGCAPDGGTP